MKKLIILLLLLSVNLIQSQNRISVTYNDGKVITGYGKVNNNGVKFKTSKKGKYTKIDKNLIDKGALIVGKRKVNFAFKPHKKGKKPMLMSLIYDGENIKIYQWSPGGFNTSAGNVGVKVKVIRYYAAKKNEEFATMLRSGSVLGKSFEKRAKKYFKDCPTLISKLGTKGYKKGGLIKVAEFYENNCTK